MKTMTKFQAIVFASRILQHYVIAFEEGSAGRYVGSHRIMAKPKRKSFGVDVNGEEVKPPMGGKPMPLFRCHASGMSWTEAVIELAQVNGDARFSYVRAHVREILEDFGPKPAAEVGDGYGDIEPIGVARFQLPDDG